MIKRIVGFSPEHLQSLDKDTLHRLGLVPGWIEKSINFAKAGPCFSAFVGDDLIACAGVNILWPGVGEAWAVVTPRVYRFPVFFHKSTKKMMNQIIKDFNLYRLQATVITQFPKGRAWLKSLGFVSEGLMRKYDTDQCDHWRYARIL